VQGSGYNTCTGKYCIICLGGTKREKKYFTPWDCCKLYFQPTYTVKNNPRNIIVKQCYFYAAPVPGKNFDAAPAPAPTLLYSKEKFLKRTKIETHIETIFFI
jgi:hypothetical protein